MQQVYRWMLDELLGRKPETIKCPGREGGYVRVPVEQNPEWYRQLCERHKSPRNGYPKPRTILRRKGVLRALVLLADGQKVETTYAERIKDVAEAYRERIADAHSKEYDAEMAGMGEF